MPRVVCGTLLVAAVTLAGCGGDSVKPLNSDAFYRPPQDRGAQSGRAQVGPLDEAGPVDTAPRSAPAPDTGNPNSSAISDVVADSVKPTCVPPGKPLVFAPVPHPATLPTTEPASAALNLTPATLPTGQYMIVGAVLAEVDGVPIYANQVFSAIDKKLSVRAKDLNADQFRAFARDEIAKEVETLRRNEVLYRAAQKSLDETELKGADEMTRRSVKEKITEAGGSEELARRRAKADGLDFDQWIEDQHRWHTTQIYFERKIYPLIVVTADMLREYYDRNLNTLFTEKTAAKFRIIKIDAKDVGSRDRALARAQEWQKLLAGGEDFAIFARDHNTDPYLKAHDGLPVDGMIDRGAYVNKPIEDAAWALQPGQVSDVITIGDVFYIVKLEQKQIGRVRPFDSEQVQSQITRALQNEQFQVLKEATEAKLSREAIYKPNPNAMDLAIEMAMQRYQQWKSEGPQNSPTTQPE